MRFLLAGLLLACMTALARAGPIPLEKGVVLVYEGYDPGYGGFGSGYIERLVTITEVTPDHIGLQIQFNEHVGEKNSSTTIVDRVERSEDLEGAHRIINQFLSDDPPMLPGSLYFHGSKAMLDELATAGTSHFVYGDSSPGEHTGFFNVGLRKYYRGDLKLAEPHAVIPVLINGTETKLDVLHAGGGLAVADLRTTHDFWFSSDHDNPLMLREQGPVGNYIQLVSVDGAAAEPEKKEVASAVETALQGRDCRATLPGIYFSTGSDILLPASEAALKQVGDVLAAHPEWQLTIEGHTDNVGADDYNLDLSKRRAASVKQALVSRFGADPAHLATTGFGESRPVQTNDTPVGRAANRRVELARSCE